MPEYKKSSISSQKLLREGLSFHKQGNLKKAQSFYNQVLQNDPNNFEALQLSATLFLQEKKFNKALEFLNHALTINSKVPYINYNLGIVLHELKRHDEALQSFNQTIQLKPDFAEAYFNRGVVLEDIERHDEALRSFNQAIQLKSDYAEAHNNRGNALLDLKRYDEALQSYDQAIKLKPDYAEAYYNRGFIYDELRSFNEALKNYNCVIKLKPNFAPAYNNLGNTLQELKLFNKALKNFDRAIQLEPNFIEPYWNKSLLKLLLGEYEEGWKLYEFRKQKKEKISEYLKFSVPLWLGDTPIEGKTILVYSEQGFGDTIQFCRYLPMLKSLKPKEIIFYVEKRLIPLLSCLNKYVTVLEKNKALPFFDYYCPLMSLPLAFKTKLETIPANVPYIYTPQEKKLFWKKKLGKKNKTRIAIMHTTHRFDKTRSLTLDQLKKLFKLPFEFHSLQINFTDDDRKTLRSIPNLLVYESKINEFEDAAGLIEQMDLVITVGQTVTHISGGLGTKTWVLVPFMPSFRWLLDRDDSPWYPTVKLFRQPKMGDWNSVIDELINELKNIKISIT